MSAYPIDKQILNWTTDKATTEQTIGQLLLYVKALEERIGLLEKRLYGKGGDDDFVGEGVGLRP